MGLVLTADFKFFLLFENNKKINIYDFKSFAHLRSSGCGGRIYRKTLGQDRASFGLGFIVLRLRSLRRTSLIRNHGFRMACWLVGRHSYIRLSPFLGGAGAYDSS